MTTNWGGMVHHRVSFLADDDNGYGDGTVDEALEARLDELVATATRAGLDGDVEPFRAERILHLRAPDVAGLAAFLHTLPGPDLDLLADGELYGTAAQLRDVAALPAAVRRGLTVAPEEETR